MTNIFVEALEPILAHHCKTSDVRRIEFNDSGHSLFRKISDAGFFELLTDESDGGAGISTRDLFPILLLLGQYAVPLPIAQTIAARWLWKNHASIPNGLIAFAPHHTVKDELLICANIPMGRVSQFFVIQDRLGYKVLNSADAINIYDSGIQGSLLATLNWESNAGQFFDIKNLPTDLMSLSASLKAVELAASIKKVFDMTLQYANDRVQFGKSIGKFQAIQHQLSVMAEHVAAASIAVQAAFDIETGPPSRMLSAIAKSRTSESAQLIAATAHAVHGAIGITYEYDLQIYTRRLHHARMAYGSESYWNQWIGEQVLASPSTQLSDFIQLTSQP
jgi:alkylation response protein AidB-like acyl-CoA dehydrogenase